jgi:hypothetical protein
MNVDNQGCSFGVNPCTFIHGYGEADEVYLQFEDKLHIFKYHFCLNLDATPSFSRINFCQF